ncbi:MAG: hypothetical protein WKF58_19175 [Ilumatobacteraceae bacterium]
MGDPTAVIGRRILAYILDALIVGAVAFIMFATQAEFIEKAPPGFCDRRSRPRSPCAPNRMTRRGSSRKAAPSQPWSACRSVPRSSTS